MAQPSSISTTGVREVIAAAGMLALAGTALGQVPCLSFSAGPASRSIVPGQPETLTLSVDSGVRLVTNEGTIDIELMLDDAPNTSANFLNYVRSGRYNGVMFHRSQRVTPSFSYALIQGGGYTTPVQAMAHPSPPRPQAESPQPIVTDPPIALEHPVGNVRGAVGMARLNDPASATSQFFINTTDNNADVPGERTSFDAVPGDPNRPGYAVFGTVTPQSLATVDAINDLTYYEMSGVFGGAFGNTPLRVTPQQLSFPMPPSVYVTIARATTLGPPATEWPGNDAWTYRWRRDGQDLADGGRISGAGTASISIANMSITDSGVYECVVTGLSCTAAAATSSAVTLSCPSDVGSAGGTVGFDGVLDNNDFIAFINLFFAGDEKADLGQAGGASGSDGAFDNNDFIVFINRFFGGC